MAIRIATQEDLPQILAIYGPNVSGSTTSFEYEVPTAEEFARRFCAITKQFPWLVWEEDGRVLGYAYAAAPFERAAYRWCAEPSIYLTPEARRKGIGTRLYAALEEILRKQGYQVLLTIITDENRGSLQFHEAQGYRFLAHFPSCGFKHGRWLGITWMEKRLAFVENPSNFPICWKEIVEITKITL